MTDRWIDDLANDHGDPAPRAGFKDELRTTLSDGWNGREIGRPVAQGNPRRTGWIVASAAATLVAVAGFAVWSQSSGPTVVTPATDPVDDVVIPPSTDVDTDATVIATTPVPADSAATPSSEVVASTAVPDAAVPDADPVPPPATDLLAAWPEPPTEVASVDEIARYLPGARVGDNIVPVRSEFAGGSAASPMFTQVFVNADLDAVITLQTDPGGIENTPDEFRIPTTIDGWDDAFFTQNGVRLVASDPSGFVRLMATGVDNDVAASLVGTMQRRVDGVPGWNLDDSLGFEEVNGAWDESAGERTLTWFEGTTVVAQMISAPDLTYLPAQAIGPSFDQVEVDGRIAWLTSTGTRRSIVWSPDGETMVVLGVVDDDIDPLELALSLTGLDESDYEIETTDAFPDGLGDGCSASLFC